MNWRITRKYQRNRYLLAYSASYNREWPLDLRELLCPSRLDGRERL